MGQSFDAAAPRPLSPEEFEKRREQAIASLRTRSFEPYGRTDHMSPFFRSG